MLQILAPNICAKDGKARIPKTGAVSHPPASRNGSSEIVMPRPMNLLEFCLLVN